jgi:hypothetical protein
VLPSNAWFQLARVCSTPLTVNEVAAPIRSQSNWASASSSSMLADDCVATQAPAARISPRFWTFRQDFMEQADHFPQLVRHRYENHRILVLEACVEDPGVRDQLGDHRRYVLLVHDLSPFGRGYSPGKGAPVRQWGRGATVRHHGGTVAISRIGCGSQV